MMEPKSAGANEYVRELLTKNNYEDWSVQMRTCLTAMDLWEDVIDYEEPFRGYTAESDRKAWMEMNAAALHMIQISCGPEAFAKIRDATSAKRAWATLADNFATDQHHRDSEASKPATGEDEDNADFLEYKPFFDAVCNDNLNEVNEFLTQHPEAVRKKLSSSGKTALHVAVSAGHLRIVERLVQLMSTEDLEAKRKADDFTALAIATDKGNIEMAKHMVEKNNKLLAICDCYGCIPVVHAVGVGQMRIALYFYSLTPLEVLLADNGLQGIQLLSQSIYMENFDIALDLFKRCPSLIFKKNKFGETPAFILATMPNVFRSRDRLRLWQRCIYNCLRAESPHDVLKHICINVQNSEDGQSNLCNFTNFAYVALLDPLGRMASNILGIPDLYKKKLAYIQSHELLELMCKEIQNFNVKQIKEAGVRQAIIRAARKGFVEFIASVSKANPELVWTPQLWKRMFGMAIHYRQARVFSLIYGIDSKEHITSYVNEFGNTILHIAGELAPEKRLNLIPGAALQMQREMQWFKEVEETVTEAACNFINNERKTAREIFTQHHKDLVNAGEKWMKETSTSCSVIGALIVTIMFTAAFTIPGGSHQDNDANNHHHKEGYPIFLKHKLFKVFLLSDAMSLFSATTSVAVLVFLGILTSRYAEVDFLKSLPTKMIVGLSTLFFSIATMVVAFCSALSLMFQHELWIVVPLILLASVPVALFVWMQFPLLAEIFKSTYGPSIFDRKMKCWLYADKTAAS